VSPLPKRDRLGEYAVKGMHAALRELGEAPEQRQGRALAKRIPVISSSGPRVLVLSPRSWAVHLQWEAVIGHSLQMRGAEVRFLTCGGGLEICDRANTWESPPPPCRTCRHYVETTVSSHGFGSSTLAEEWEGIDGSWPEIDELSLDELEEVEFEGIQLGRLTGIPVRWFLMRADLSDDPLAALTFRRFLRAARAIVVAVRAAVDRERPDVVLLCNGLFLFESITWAVCREQGIPVVTYERGFIQETLVVEANAAACLFDVDDEWAVWRDVPLTDEEHHELEVYLGDREVGRRTIDRFWSGARFDDPERARPGRLVTLFSNLTWDSAVIGQGLAFDGIADWVTAAVELFAGRPDDELVIRVHPAEVKLPGKQTREPLEPLLRERFAQLPPNVRVVPADDLQSSYPLMASSDAVLVFTSTTGLEAAVRGTPVVVAGRTHYRGKGFTTDVSDPGEFVAAVNAVLDRPEDFVPDRELVERYAYLFFFRHPIPAPWVEEHVLGLARLTVDDPAQLAPGADAGLDRICDLVLESARRGRS
jgi:hypothetical protein